MKLTRELALVLLALVAAFALNNMFNEVLWLRDGARSESRAEGAGWVVESFQFVGTMGAHKETPLSEEPDA